MSKAIRWQVPFVSNSGVKYQVDIYDEVGSWSGITTLLAGPKPFVTDEDDSKDFFTPVRIQTGNLQVCTAIPGGGKLQLEDILPANNIAHPVQLVSIASDMTETVEWQGFLSCEAYNQDYTSIPEILSLPVNGVLEAMDSVFLDTTLANGLQETRMNIYYALTELDRQCGMADPFFSYIYYSRASVNFMEKMIDASILYEIKEYNNEESTSLVVRGMSCKQAIERICKFMGWIMREQGKNVFLQRINEDFTVYKQALADFGGAGMAFNNRTEMSVTTANIADMVWMGRDHKRSIDQGAKSVEVIANITQFNLQMGLPDFPTENLQFSSQHVINAYYTFDNDFINSLTFNYYEVTVGNQGTHISVTGPSDIETAFADCVLSPDCYPPDQYPDLSSATYVLVKNIGGFFAMLDFSTPDKVNWVKGLYIVAINELNATGEHAPAVFQMDSIISYRLIDGSLKFKMSGLTITDVGTDIIPFVGQVDVMLRFGSQYWNGSAWQSTQTFFAADFSNQDPEEEVGDYVLTIPITSQLTGDVSIAVRGSIRGGTQYSTYYTPFYDLFLHELSLQYVEPIYVTESDRDSNHYSTLLSTNFRDEISIVTELASSLNNRPSPSLIMDSATAPMKTMYYYKSDGTVVQRRPENDLLMRMAAYYSAARQRLDLEVGHPTAAELPMLKLNGINDGKTYLPLSESRDWKEDSCELICFETV